MPDQIHHWQSYFGLERTLEQHAAMNPNGMLDRSTPTGTTKRPSAIARVSGSCWIIDCPKKGCGGAEFVNFDDLRFFCCSCRNSDWNGDALPVTVPDTRTRQAIELVLTKRPEPTTRNWLPGEDVADLKVENLKNGVKP